MSVYVSYMRSRTVWSQWNNSETGNSKRRYILIYVCDVIIAELDETRRGEARRGEARRGEARRGEARRGEARRGEARRGEARRGEARRGEARRGETRRDETRHETTNIPPPKRPAEKEWRPGSRGAIETRKLLNRRFA